MRVIAGKARSVTLNTIQGMDTRPTTDRIKETLFNMIQYDVPESDFLDLFSGSGAIGIEALSRGAKTAVFVEKNKAAVRCIQENLKKCKLEDDATVMAVDYMSALKALERDKKRFDLIFLDPPYNHEFEKEVLIYLSKSDLIDEESTIIIEASMETELTDVEALGFEIKKEKRYKTNKHYFVQRKEMK
ncbi:MAG: 16S rRNA (guanine(966)-N(2))-methyltransferase RsmD [Eubacterium sp.]|nr:16S rRNA (guanine(966)-N(2))-methyltransferase RsmD [Eubacterium sp.]